MAHRKNPKKTGGEQENLSPWQVVEQGVLICSDEKGFSKLHRASLPRIVEKIQVLIKRDFDSPRFMGEARDIALDALTDTCRIVARKGLSLDGRNGFEAYVLKSARNLLLRKSMAKPHAEVFLDIEEVVFATGVLTPLERERRLARLKRTLGDVCNECFKDNDIQWEVMHRHIVKGEKFGSIAKDLDLKVDNAKQLKSRGLKSLRERYGGILEDLLEELHLLDRDIGSENIGTHIQSTCEETVKTTFKISHSLPTEQLKIMRRRGGRIFVSEKTHDVKGKSTVTGMRRPTADRDISDRRLEKLLKLLSEDAGQFAGSNHTP